MRKITVGRNPQSDIFINDSNVSKNHAEIIIDNNITLIRDVGSTNGTYVNGVRINGNYTLQTHDILKIGNTLIPWKNYINTNNNINGIHVNDTLNVNSQNISENSKISVSDWILILLLTSIPFVGFILLIVWANQDNIPKKNFAKGALWFKLILFCIFLILFFAIYLLFRDILVTITNYLNSFLDFKNIISQILNIIK